MVDAVAVIVKPRLRNLAKVRLQTYSSSVFSQRGREYTFRNSLQSTSSLSNGLVIKAILIKRLRFFTMNRMPRSVLISRTEAKPDLSDEDSIPGDLPEGEWFF